ncbi:MAG TPA: cytochrome-c oxidase, cbb3-type subunit II [Rhodospirillaceae bacterium]|nr:cytochrome-c oxidase, cbb3-type subunit II [Rhodospirillaceae bacterium]
MSFLRHHAKFETNVLLLMVGILVTVIIGGIVEVLPLFTIQETIENVQGIRPYSPLEQAGRDIYIREGCYVCHSQMIRPFRDEVERYGHYSLAAESMYDHPFQWGSKRSGPDLARVGGKYTNDWHVRHLTNPRDVVPESIMPGYKFMHRPLAYDDIVPRMKVLRIVGVPYTEDDIANAKADLEAQASSDANTEALLQRYPKASLGKKDRTSEKVTEMDALVAYLQVLGTMVDFTTLKSDAIR